MRIILGALAAGLALPAVAQVVGTPAPTAPVSARVLTPPNKALLLQLNGLNRQKMTAEAGIAQQDKAIAGLQVKKAAGGLSDSDVRALAAATAKRATLQTSLAQIVIKISAVEAALAGNPG